MILLAHWEQFHPHTRRVYQQIHHVVQQPLPLSASHSSKSRAVFVFTFPVFQKAFTAFGPTIIQPTWFCSRKLFNQVGKFSEQGKVSY